MINRFVTHAKTAQRLLYNCTSQRRIVCRSCICDYFSSQRRTVVSEVSSTELLRRTNKTRERVCFLVLSFAQTEHSTVYHNASQVEQGGKGMSGVLMLRGRVMVGGQRERERCEQVTRQEKQSFN